MKVLAVGDIHTKLWILDEVRRVIDNYDAVVFCGDYADDFNKGPILSIYTWESLMSLQKDYAPKVHVVLGNHDYIYAFETPSLQSGYSSITQRLLDTPENRKIRDWLRALPVLREVDGIVYSHAGVVKPYNPKGGIKSHNYLAADLWNDLSPLWVRPDDGFEYIEGQVFGHTPSKTCWEVQPNVWCIDTFSTYPDGTPIGDYTVLEITDGNKFKKVKIKDDNNSTNSKSV